MIFASEPLLYPEVVYKIYSAVRKMNILERKLITNGYFSKDVNRIKEVSYMLAQNAKQPVVALYIGTFSCNYLMVILRLRRTMTGNHDLFE